MFKKALPILILLVLFLMEICIVLGFEESRVSTSQFQTNLTLTRAQSLGVKNGEIHIKVYLRNDGMQTCSYPYLQIESGEETFYLDYDESQRPLASSSVTEIPAAAEASGLYVLDEYATEALQGKTAKIYLDEYSSLTHSSCEVEL